jgi:hypothetical protein
VESLTRLGVDPVPCKVIVLSLEIAAERYDVEDVASDVESDPV